MSVAQTAARISLQAGNGVKLAFDGSWKIFATSDLKVYKVAANGVYTLQAITTNYTVSFDTDAETWTVTFLVAPVSGGYAAIFGSEVPFTQAASVPREGVEPAATRKNVYDKAVVLMQQLRDRLDRAPLQPQTPAAPGAIVIAAPVDGKGLLWTDNGDGTFNIDSSTDDLNDIVTNAEAAEAAALASQTAAAASAAAASGSAVAAAASAAAAATFALAYSSGLKSARPVAPTTGMIYEATDEDNQLYIWTTGAGAWRPLL